MMPSWHAICAPVGTDVAVTIVETNPPGTQANNFRQSFWRIWPDKGPGKELHGPSVYLQQGKSRGVPGGDTTPQSLGHRRGRRSLPRARVWGTAGSSAAMSTKQSAPRAPCPPGAGR